MHLLTPSFLYLTISLHVFSPAWNSRWGAILGKAPVANVHHVLQAHIGPWLGLLVTQPGVALSNDAMLVVKHTRPATVAEGEEDVAMEAGSRESTSDEAPSKRRKKNDARREGPDIPQISRPPPAKALVGGAAQETSPDSEVVLAARAGAARAIGEALATSESGGSPVGHAVTALLELLTIEPGVPKLALRRMCGGLVAGEWAAASQASFPPSVHGRLVTMLSDAAASDVSFAELNGLVQRLRGQVGADCFWAALELFGPPFVLMQHSSLSVYLSICIFLSIFLSFRLTLCSSRLCTHTRLHFNQIALSPE